MSVYVTISNDYLRNVAIANALRTAFSGESVMAHETVQGLLEQLTNQQQFNPRPEFRVGCIITDSELFIDEKAHRADKPNAACEFLADTLRSRQFAYDGLLIHYGTRDIMSGSRSMFNASLLHTSSNHGDLITRIKRVQEDPSYYHTLASGINLTFGK